MPRKAANSKRLLPDPLPRGEVLTDLAKRKWVLDKSIGVGGFGEIYSAGEYNDSKSLRDYPCAIKIEPHDNGPLFCEMHFFMRNAKPDMIQSWCSEKKLSVFGMPRLLGSGSHEIKDRKYRFLVMDKYGTDLHNIFLKNNKRFPLATVYRIGLQILDVLEYIHIKEYVHADIKASNLLLGNTKQTQNTVFLVDFGLACRYSQQEFKPDPKRAHNGTIEYTSRDAHDGVSTRRGDLEILAYNMIEWTGCNLPWKNILNNPSAVQADKKKHMANIPNFLKTCFGKDKIPSALKDFVEYVGKMDYNTEPDYEKCRTILQKGVKESGGKLTGALQFSVDQKRKSEDEVDISDTTPDKKRKMTPKRNAKSKKIEENVKEVKASPVRKRTTPKKENEIFTAEMKRVMQMKEKKTLRNKSRKNVKNDDSDLENGDIIENTPPEVYSRKRTAKKTEKNGTGDTTPRTLRSRK